MDEYLKLDYNDIKKKYPKAVAKIKETFANDENVKNGLQQIGADIREDEVLTRVIEALITHDPRKLYDLFDKLIIRISITYNKTTEIWTYYNSVQDYSYTADSRIESEKKAFEEAFDVLEKQLTG